MKSLYDTLSAVVKSCLPIAGAFNKKIKQGALGRERTWDILDQKVKSTLPKIWVHVASLGEYEQIVPVLEKIDRKNYQVVLTFFSPSGYENKKDTSLADVVGYLPIDTFDNSRKFLDLVDPSLAIMVKYEFWPNYLNGLKKRGCKTILVSGIFRKNMTFHKWYGKWMVESLEAFDHFFLQNDNSLVYLNDLGFTNASVNGDTRFDRASQLIERDNSVEILNEFVGNKPCLVIGSSWPADIEIMKSWINKTAQEDQIKIIIAPHEVGTQKISGLQKGLSSRTVLWSEIITDNTISFESPVLIIDTIGLLTKAYSYSSVAFIGGAMGKTGLHNILEAATFGVPVIIGKNYKKYPEAGKLEDLGGLFSVKNANEFKEILDRLFSDDQLREKTGMISGHWINSNTGATREIVNYLKNENKNFINP
ncbi:MAG: glycosyltransferase N-terminal domain-containing protein [Nonlabens sp.]